MFLLMSRRMCHIGVSTFDRARGQGGEREKKLREESGEGGGRVAVGRDEGGGGALDRGGEPETQFGRRNKGERLCLEDFGRLDRVVWVLGEVGKSSRPVEVNCPGLFPLPGSGSEWRVSHIVLEKLANNPERGFHIRSVSRF